MFFKGMACRDHFRLKADWDSAFNVTNLPALLKGAKALHVAWCFVLLGRGNREVPSLCAQVPSALGSTKAVSPGSTAALSLTLEVSACSAQPTYCRPDSSRTTFCQSLLGPVSLCV